MSSRRPGDQNLPVDAQSISPSVQCFGVDGCKGGWVFAGLSEQGAAFGTVVRLETLVNAVAAGSSLFVDIPIGLREDVGGARHCDREARRLLSPYRASSVFNAPIRAVIDIADYHTANSTSRQLSGQGLSKQSFNIIPKIREVDQLMVNNLNARALVREAHPEVCFYGLAGGRPMQYGKKTREGYQERLSVLARYQPGVERDVSQALTYWPRSVVAADDILDALACAVTSKMRSFWKSLPASPELDSRGLPMEIVYCRV